MRLPSLYQFEVDENITNFFITKLNQYKIDINYVISKNSSSTINGIQTKNILKFADMQTLEVLNDLRFTFEKTFQINLEYFWVHMIEYEHQGYQNLHDHSNNEDFSFILYLNSCDTGNTTFILNQSRDIKVVVKPIKNTGVFFLSSLHHSADITTDNKKVLVGGLRLL